MYSSPFTLLVFLYLPLYQCPEVTPHNPHMKQNLVNISINMLTHTATNRRWYKHATHTNTSRCIIRGVQTSSVIGHVVHGAVVKPDAFSDVTPSNSQKHHLILLIDIVLLHSTPKNNLSYYSLVYLLTYVMWWWAHPLLEKYLSNDSSPCSSQPIPFCSYPSVNHRIYEHLCIFCQTCVTVWHSSRC